MPGGALPSQAPTGTNGAARSVDAQRVEHVYVAHDSDVVVYPASASRAVMPARTIAGPATGLANIRGVSVDIYGGVYVAVATGGVTVLVFAPGAHGNVAPVRTLHAGDTATETASYAGAVGVRYDGTVAVDVGGYVPGRDIHEFYQQVLGIFDLTGTYTAESTLGYGIPRSLTVDGSGNVLFSFLPALYAIRPAQGTVVNRLSPHPDGYYDDGTIYRDSVGGVGSPIAASGYDDLQLGTRRMNGSSLNPLVPVATLGGGITDQSAIAFDAEGRLYAISGAAGDSGDVVLVYPHAVHNGQLPTRTLRGLTGRPVVGIAVGP